jgi:hypothetical protein
VSININTRRCSISDIQVISEFLFNTRSTVFEFPDLVATGNWIENQPRNQNYPTLIWTQSAWATMTVADRRIGRFRKHFIKLFTRLQSLKVYCPFCQETHMSKKHFHPIWKQWEAACKKVFSRISSQGKMKKRHEDLVECSAWRQAACARAGLKDEHLGGVFFFLFSHKCDTRSKSWYNKSPTPPPAPHHQRS